MKNLLSSAFGPFYGGRAAVGLLILRLVIGYAFVLHGLPKIQNPFGWMGPKLPGFLQALAALAEFGGGLALIFGFVNSLAALGIFITMVVAKFVAHGNDPFVGRESSWEILGVYMAATLALILTGPGKFSLDALLFGRKSSNQDSLS